MLLSTRAVCKAHRATHGSNNFFFSPLDSTEIKFQFAFCGPLASLAKVSQNRNSLDTDNLSTYKSKIAIK